MKKPLDHEAVVNAILTEAKSVNDFTIEEIESAIHLIADLTTDTEKYMEVVQNFYQQDGFGYRLTERFLQRYLDNLEMVHFSRGAAGYSGLGSNTYIVEVPSDIKSSENIALIVYENNRYVPFFGENPIHQEIAKRLNRNDKTIKKPELLPPAQLPALYAMISAEGNGKWLSKEMYYWLHSNSPSLLAMIHSNLSDIVSQMRKSRLEKTRQLADVAYYYFMDTDMANEVKKVERISEIMGIPVRTLKRRKIDAVTAIAWSFIPLRVGETKLAEQPPLFGDSLELYSGGLSREDGADILNDFRFRYSVKDEIEYFKSLRGAGLITEKEFESKKNSFKDAIREMHEIDYKVKDLSGIIESLEQENRNEIKSGDSTYSLIELKAMRNLYLSRYNDAKDDFLGKPPSSIKRVIEKIYELSGISERQQDFSRFEFPDNVSDNILLHSEIDILME